MSTAAEPTAGWRARLAWPSLGDLAASMLLLVIASGIVLALHYRPTDEAYAAIAAIEQDVPAGWYLRRVHHVAGQLLLIGALAHVASVLWRRSEGRFRPWRGAKLVALLPLAVLGCFTGFVLRGSAEGQHAATVAIGLAGSVPGIGDVLARSLYRPEPSASSLWLPYTHHLATITASLLYLTGEHVGRLRRRPAALGWAALVVAAVALVLPAPTGHAPDAVLQHAHGPWFFVGIQQLLRWLPPLLAGIAVPALALALLWLVPRFEGRARIALVVALAAGLAAYAAVSLTALAG